MKAPVRPARTARAARPIPASIPMPDAALRSHWAYQLYCRLARPSLDWVGVAGAAWSLGLGDIMNKPMPEALRLIVLGFVGALYGIRTFEKTKGVA
jgi:hypothetical protein